MQIHNLDNKVFVIDEFLPERDFKLVETFARHLVLPYTQRSSGWSPEIILDSKKVKMGRAFLDAKPAPLAVFETALRKVRKVPWPEGRSLSLLVYEWQHGSYIPLHDDHCVHFAVTYYLNSTWNPNWGGDLMVMTRPADDRSGDLDLAAEEPAGHRDCRREASNDDPVAVGGQAAHDPGVRLYR